MKKIAGLLILFLFLSGCATYKFQKGQSPYDKGYVASRDGRTILEYTVGKENSVPEELKLAKERFKKRRGIVEYYYKKMRYIENNFKKTFWGTPASFFDLATGIFRLPFAAVSDFRYENNPKYRQRVKALEEEQQIREAARIKTLKDKLNDYIQKELTKETPLTEHPKAKQQAQEAAMATLLEAKKEIKQQVSNEGVSAIIIAKPIKGTSPLKVQFYGYKSHSPHGKIFSYYWEFGDGDTSTEKNPVNTYICKVFGVTPFTATLTVKDEKGNTAASSVVIEVKTAK